MFRQVLPRVAAAAVALASALFAACQPTTAVTEETVLSYYQGITAGDSSYVGDTMKVYLSAFDTQRRAITGLTINWGVVDPAVATVLQTSSVTSSNGSASVDVVMKQAGTAVITAVPVNIKVESGGNGALQIPVPVSGIPTSIRVTPRSGTLAIGGTAKVQARLYDDQGRWSNTEFLTFTAMDTATAVFNEPLLGAERHFATLSKLDSVALKASSAGTARVRVTVPKFPNLSDVATFTVGTNGTITVTPTADVIVGGRTTLTAVVRDAAGNILPNATVTWTSGNTAVASVNGQGQVTGLISGSAAGLTQQVTITADAGNNLKATSLVTVYRNPATVQVTPALSLNIGESGSVDARLMDTDGTTTIPLSATTLTWTTDQPGTATVAASTTVAGRATVTGVTAGTTQVRATTREGLAGVAAVTIKAPASTPASMTLSPSSATIGLSATQQFNAIVKDANGATTSCPLGWAIAGSNVASISGTGLATPKAAGTTPVHAFCTSDQNIFAAAKLVVTDASGAASVTLSTRHVFLEVGQTFQYVATVKDANGTTLPNATVTWATSTPTAADFGGNSTATGAAATVTAKADGGSTITATSGGQQEIAWVTVGARGAIKGQIVSTSGQYLGASYATAVLSGTTTQITSNINSEGIFYFAGLAPGNYTVTVQPSIAGSQTFTVAVQARQTTLVGSGAGIITVK